jgi:cellulose synthase/poly-beta-1,6-N-acetylglucosamine synthase-like glycosyltransferase
VQAEYLLGVPPSPSPVALVSAVALLLKNRVRPLGLAALGLPCHLTGSGMAFTWNVFRQAPETGSNLVEDMVMGLDLALAGRPPLFCPEVHISSELPSGDHAGLGQRKRWEHGVLDTVRRYVPRLLSTAVKRRNVALAALALDLAVPPLALLVMLQLSVVAATALAYGATDGFGPGPLLLATGSLLAVGVAVLVSWAAFAGPELPLRYAVFVPLYLLWKIPLYLTLLLRGKQKTWERTARRQRPQ